VDTYTNAANPGSDCKVERNIEKYVLSLAS
jgi:hypothetical protein